MKSTPAAAATTATVTSGERVARVGTVVDCFSVAASATGEWEGAGGGSDCITVDVIAPGVRSVDGGGTDTFSALGSEGGPA